MIILRKLSLLALLLSVAGGVSACNDTWDGMGEDAEDAAEEIDEAL